MVPTAEGCAVGGRLLGNARKAVPEVMEERCERGPARSIGPGEEMDCPLCAGDRPTVCEEYEGFLIGRCRICGLVYVVNPVPPASVPELYDECYFGSLSKQAYGPEGAGNPYHRALWFINHQRMRAIASLTGGWGRGKRLLDVGCGPGFFISTARDFGWDPTGVEISSVAAGFGARSYGLEILQGDLLDLDLPSRSFDVITMWHLLEHLPEPMATLRLARQLLREGGWLVVEVPNLESLFFRLTARPYRGAAHPRFHRQSFSHRTLERALRCAGFGEILPFPSTYHRGSPSLENLARWMTKLVLHSLGRDSFLGFAAR
jgi:2-polyprenyl-3-methyl-5-hydroxy-6-metoxy-1,4-benzoquinol methylase